MKYNILGFYQPRAVELGLESNDLLVLRWFIDYAGTNKMRTMIIDNKIYYWINYNSVLEELPILKITKQTLARKHFGNLVKANVLEHKFVNEGGSFSYYCYGINYDALVYLQSDGGCVKNNEGMSKNTQGYVNSDIGGMSENTHQINNTLNNNNSIKLKIKENIEKKKFVPPTLEEIDSYVKERGSKVDSKFFYDYYTAGKWIDAKGDKVRNWKQKLITWEKKGESSNVAQQPAKKGENDSLFDNLDDIDLRGGK